MREGDTVRVTCTPPVRGELSLTDIIVSRYARDNNLPNPITGDGVQRDLLILAEILDEHTEIDKLLHSELTSGDSV